MSSLGGWGLDAARCDCAADTRAAAGCSRPRARVSGTPSRAARRRGVSTCGFASTYRGRRCHTIEAPRLCKFAELRSAGSVRPAAQIQLAGSWERIPVAHQAVAARGRLARGAGRAPAVRRSGARGARIRGHRRDHQRRRRLCAQENAAHLRGTEEAGAAADPRGRGRQAQQPRGQVRCARVRRARSNVHASTHPCSARWRLRRAPDSGVRGGGGGGVRTRSGGARTGTHAGTRRPGRHAARLARAHPIPPVRLDEQIKKCDDQLMKFREQLKKTRPGPAQEALKRRAMTVRGRPLPGRGQRRAAGQAAAVRRTAAQQGLWRRWPASRPAGWPAAAAQGWLVGRRSSEPQASHRRCAAAMPRRSTPPPPPHAHPAPTAPPPAGPAAEEDV